MLGSAPRPATASDRQPFVALQVAEAVSLSGNQLAALAIPWFVLERTGSATLTGVAGAAAILPVVLASFFGGAFVDRLGFKKASVAADLASAAAVALVPALDGAGLLGFPVLLGLVFLGALLDAPGATARAALVPDLAARAGMPIERATSTTQAVERGSRLLGAPLAGGLVAAFGPTAVLWIDAASFLVSAAIVAIAVPRLPAPERPVGAAGGYLAELAEGLSFVRGDRTVLALLLLLAVTNFLDALWAATVAPVFAREAYGSAVALGLLFGASGGGALLGAVVYGAVGHRFRRFPIFLIGFVVAGAKTLALAPVPPLPAAVAVSAVSGLGAGPLNPILGAVRFERVPAALRGRVFGVTTAVAFATMPLGALAGGPLLGAVGLRGTLLLIGGAYVAATLSMAFSPAIRAIDEQPGTNR